MSDVGGHWFDVPLADLTPDQRVRLDQALRAEGIPAAWGGTTLRVDVAYEARVTTLVEEARAAAGAGASGAPFGTSAAPPPAPGPYATPPAYPAPPAYAAPGYGTRTPTTRTNTMAIASLVLGIAGLVLLCGLPSPIGLYCGIRARREIRATGEQGDGLALAGIITSAIGVAFLVLGLLWLLFVLVVAGFGSTTG